MTKRLLRPYGFTLMELVVVIAIISILAAVAMPRLIEAQRDARVAKARMLYGALRSAAALGRARCELDLGGTAPSSGKASCRDTPPWIEMDGLPVRIVNRHPAATADGIDVAAAINLAADSFEASDGSAVNALGVSVPSRSYVIGGGRSSSCGATYLEAGLNGSSIVGAEARLTTEGC